MNSARVWGRRSLAALVCLLAFDATAVLAAPIGYNISLDTRSISGTGGSIEFQFIPSAPVQSLTATISFYRGGTLAGAPTIIGSVTGALPGVVTLDNSAFLNDMLQGLTYGNDMYFQVTFSGPALDTPNPAAGGTSFSFFLLDAALNPLFPVDPSGAALVIDTLSNGTQTVNAANIIHVELIPEPTTGLLFAVGLAGFFAYRRYGRDGLKRVAA